VEFEQLALFDTTVSYSLFILIDTVLSSLGDIEHPDKEIQEFCRENVDRMGGLTDSATSIYKAFYKMIHCNLWAGFSVTENIFKVEDGSLWLDDFITYHPATITLRPDRKGRMIEGKPSMDTYESGIWQSADTGDVKLPMWKCVRLCRSEMYGNYYGVSALESVFKWCALKDALLDMMATALDRFGNPVIALTFPLFNSQQTEIDPETGEEKTLNTQELLERQILANQFSGGGNVLLLPQVDEKMKPTAQVLTTGNNVGSTFLEALYNCDREVSKGLYVPYGLSSIDNKVSGDMSQQQMEMFNRVLRSVYKEAVQPIISQSFHRLIKLNFNRESAKIAPTMPIKQSNRPEDRQYLMQVITGLTNVGYFNPQNETDWTMVRQMVDASDRKMDEKDLKFIKDMIITPRQSTGSSTNPASSNPSRVKGTAGVKKPKGSGPGRPVGTSAPKARGA
jgi:hypothetical protein